MQRRIKYVENVDSDQSNHSIACAADLRNVS